VLSYELSGSGTIQLNISVPVDTLVGRPAFVRHSRAKSNSSRSRASDHMDVKFPDLSSTCYKRRGREKISSHLRKIEGRLPRGDSQYSQSPLSETALSQL
jgi:hypothetical protein